jgi:hypothetical protein
MAAINPNPDAAGFMQRYNLPFQVGTAVNEEARAFMELSMMMPGYVPWYVLIDRTSTIRNQWFGNDPFFSNEDFNIRQNLTKLLAEKPAPRAPAKAAQKKKG